jgi:hypothetical protein
VNSAGADTTTYTIPADTLPAGEYAVVAFGWNIDASDDAVVHFTAVPLVNGTQVGFSAAGNDVTLPPLVGPRFHHLGMVHLPPIDMPEGAASTIKIQITNTSAAAQFDLYDTYLLNISNGRVSEFYCGTNAAASSPLVNNRLWIDSPAVENQGLGRYVMGTVADRSDARSALLPEQAVPAVHEFPAGGVKVFTVVDGPATAVTTTYRYRPAGHSSVYSG